MAFFPDLSPYTDFPGESAGTLNVGWLDPSTPFPTGETPEEFQAKLVLLCQRPVRQTRGFHSCPFCTGRSWEEVPKASAEMRVRGDEKVYAAPTLIHHYVLAHGYKPPEEFIAAVLAWDVTDPTSGEPPG
jgi:hypothetical protein